ncbi:MAG: LacI family DNA-binding transcriptional regulator [Propionibacteriaceae bacterium]|nr:LacI family DNA-binding transcriptional regulator [Micropruina sp.]HBX82790.1 LacI family transcriptional regulator [Propionibacteriaceae bacterium]HBY23755.1 LacI family transcriptional regulator [Propionibacteriaceae bacterium]
MTSTAGRQRPPTMADLARLAGVSITTVSHVLNDTRFVSADVRQRVMAAVEQNGYIPNSVARSMKTATTNMIGLAAPALSKVALADVVRPIEVEARAQKLSVLLTDTEDAAAPELAAIKALSARRVDGIIIAPSAPDSPAVRYLRKHGIPTVVVDRFTTGGFDQIGTENTSAAEQLTDHLIEARGARRIGLITSMPMLSTTLERRKGYRKALKRHGIEVDPNLIGSGFDDPDHVLTTLKGFMALPDPPTAIVSGNSSTTLSLMRAAGILGIRVPEDLALVGFDDFAWADFFQPRLTVVRQRTDEIGVRAIRLLMRRIADPEAPVTTRRIPTDFIHRESCGCALDGATPPSSL